MKNLIEREIDYTKTIQQHLYQCKNCGRKEVIRFDCDKTVCSHCKHYIFKNPLDEFKYRIKEQITRKERE